MKWWEERRRKQWWPLPIRCVREGGGRGEEMEGKSGVWGAGGMEGGWVGGGQVRAVSGGLVLE